MPRAARPLRALKAENALIKANEYILFNYPTCFTGIAPQRMRLEESQQWIVPIVLTSTGYGIVGMVGVVALDAATGAILGSTPRAEVVAAGKQLRKGKHDALQAAFLRATTESLATQPFLPTTPE